MGLGWKRCPPEPTPDTGGRGGTAETGRGRDSVHDTDKEPEAQSIELYVLPDPLAAAQGSGERLEQLLSLNTSASPGAFSNQECEQGVGQGSRITDTGQPSWRKCNRAAGHQPSFLSLHIRTLTGSEYTHTYMQRSFF